MATATQYTTMKTLSMYYGTGALAKKNGVAIRPSPGRSGLLSVLESAFSPTEVRARFANILGNKNNKDGILNTILKNSEVQNVVLVIRSYGETIGHFFRNLGPGGGVVPARSVVSKANASDFNKQSQNIDESRVRLKSISSESEYRNLKSPNAYTAEEISQINVALSGHTDWATIEKFYVAQTSNIKARFNKLKETFTKSNELQSWNFSGRKVSIERGLFITVASGFESDGREILPGKKPERSTYMGRRVDTIPVNRPMEYIERLRREWAEVILADSGIDPKASEDIIRSAILKGCPVDLAKDGTPLARLVYDKNLIAGSSILIAAPYLGFMDRGRINGKMTKEHPDVLEKKFDEKWDDYQKRIMPSNSQKPVSRRFERIAEMPMETFNLKFGELCKGIKPSDTAIVFESGTSRRLSLVHRTTGVLVSDVPVINLSNIPEGKYLRIPKEHFKEWKNISPEKRNPLSSIYAGSAIVANGTLSHFNMKGLLHNDFDGPSVVRPDVENGIEIMPKGVAWHNLGVSMKEEDFLKLRKKQNEQIKSKQEAEQKEEIKDELAYIKKPEFQDNDVFGSVLDESPQLRKNK